ncbi:MAG: potassium-transporting ATPase subunit KdpB [Parachlamydiales bacterium]|nr:potassium-transporting ATPase subunit KdpB [Parachlamydiales bacterium]
MSYSKLFFSAFLLSLKKFSFHILYKNPVMFITEIGAILTIFEIFLSKSTTSFNVWVSVILWITVFFANFAEAMAESRNKAQANFLKQSKKSIEAKKIVNDTVVLVNANDLKKGDTVLVKINEIIPCDGEIIQGSASIDESSVTGESEPVIRASGTDHNSVICGTRVLSDEIKIKVTSDPGHSFLDEMIKLIEGAKRKRTHNEIALTILLSALTLIFLIVIICLKVFGVYFSIDIQYSILIAFLICLIPTTIASLLSSIGIAGINRLMKKNVLAMSGQAIEAAGDIDYILLDKTGTITTGERKAIHFYEEKNIKREEFLKVCYLTCLYDETTEGRSILEFVNNGSFTDLNGVDLKNVKYIPFSADTRISGIDIDNQSYRKGPKEVIEKFLNKKVSDYLEKTIFEISSKAGTPLVVASNKEILGVIFLKDVVKTGLKDLFDVFRQMNIRTVMITGDNKVTAKTIAEEINIDDFLAEATPKDKLHYLQKLHKEGHMVAMTGDGVNDAPALAQADVGLVMNSGTQAAKEAGNMIDLDSSPIKLFKIIEIGKQMLMTRGSLTTFSIANDLAKYFAIIPAILMPYFPFIQPLNIMKLSTYQNAIISALIYNALIIILLIPLAFKGVKLIPKDPMKTFKKNMTVYALGGLILPFVFIKFIDIIINHFKLF